MSLRQVFDNRYVRRNSKEQNGGVCQRAVVSPKIKINPFPAPFQRVLHWAAFWIHAILVVFNGFILYHVTRPKHLETGRLAAISRNANLAYTSEGSLSEHCVGMAKSRCDLVGFIATCHCFKFTDPTNRCLKKAYNIYCNRILVAIREKLEYLF